MSTLDTLSKTIYDTLTSANSKKPTPYDTPAEVIRVEGNTAWVHIPGGIDETPVQRTISASPGDTVQVRVSGGRAWIMGNATAPPTDDTRANVVYEYTKTVDEKATSALEDASRAKNAADAAEASASTAATAAASAVESATAAGEAAGEAKTMAQNASTAAASAQSAATTANNSANSALTQLGVVEDVIGTLNWISEHGTYTSAADHEPLKIHMSILQ